MAIGSGWFSIISLLQWQNQGVPRRVSFVELLFDMPISFAVYAPQEMQKLRTV